MAHIAMVSIPAPGHVYPSLEVVRRLVERGHRVSYVNDPSFRTTLEAVGATLVPYDSVLPRTNHADAGEAAGPGFEGDTIDHLAAFQEEYEAMLPVVLAHVADDRPDLFCYDIAGIPARIAADRWGIPALQLSPTYVAWEGYEDDMADFHAWLHADERGIALLARQRRLLQQHGVEAEPLTYLGRPPRCVALVAESMQPHVDRVDRSVVTFVGPAVRRPDPEVTWRPPTGRRVVLVSLGTAFTDLPGFYRACLEAFAGWQDWHLVLQVGRHVDLDDVTGGRALPAHVELERWVPQVEVLQHADAFVTHAGMGGAGEGLASGTPMLAVPQAVDQHDNADALVAAGVAVRMDAATADVASLREALAQVTSADVVSRAREVAAELGRLGGAGRAVEVVESML